MEDFAFEGDNFLTTSRRSRTRLGRRLHSSAAHLARLLRSTLSELGHEPSAEQAERAAFLVYRAMTGRQRDYHSIDHVFAVASGLPALARLAAIYHDTVYIQIDGGISDQIWERVGAAVRMDAERAFLAEAEALEPHIADVARIFGLEPGREIDAQGGLNEFLSAVLAVRELGPLLKQADLWTLAACIELTIPFRGADSRGLLPVARLGERLSRLSELRGARLDKRQLHEMLALAVRTANSDVHSFARADVGAFLDDTWRLLPETNPELQGTRAFSLGSYRGALCRTEIFLSTLNPSTIFQQYEGSPSHRLYGIFRGRAQINVAKSCEYLRARIVLAAVLEGLADQTGGDVPISYFIGSDSLLRGQGMT